MSGGSLRSLLMKRSNSAWPRIGSTSVMPRQVADGRVGGRAPALAQDALAARELDDVVDGQEIRLVLQVADQAQLFLDLRGDRLGHALREAARGAGLRLLAQVGGGRVARRHDLVRILVAQLVQRSRSAAPPPASAPAPRAGTGWPAACACAGGARRYRPARSRSATPAGGCGCRPACRAAAGASAGASGPGPAPPAAARLPARPPRWRRGAESSRERCSRVSPTQARRGNTRASQRACSATRAASAPYSGVRMARHSGRPRRCAQPGGGSVKSSGASRYSPLGARAPARDQLGQVAVALARLRQQGQAQRCRVGRGAQLEAGADEQRQVELLCLHVRAHHAGQAALVGDGQGCIAQLGGAGGQLFRMRGALQERELLWQCSSA